MKLLGIMLALAFAVSTLTACIVVDRHGRGTVIVPGVAIEKGDNGKHRGHDKKHEEDD